MISSTDPPLGGDRLLPWRAVRALTGISRTTLWRLQKAGQFPKPVRVSPGRIAWREHEVAAWTAGLSPRGEPAPAPAPIEAAPAADLRPDPVAQARRPQRLSVEPAGRRRRPPPRTAASAQTRQMSFDF